MDGDGLADLLVGQYNGTASVAGDGGAWLFEASTLAGGGTFSPADADQVLAGEEAGSFSGWAVYGAGDLDGDGAPDLLVGAPGWGLYGYGRAYLVLNPL
jgi:glycosylphosphatidylinositol phospholipase D